MACGAACVCAVGTCSSFGSCTPMDCSAATTSELTSDRKLGLLSGELGGLTGVLRGGEVAATLKRGALFIINRGTRRIGPLDGRSWHGKGRADRRATFFQ